MGEEEEVSSTQWYPGKDCSVLVDVWEDTVEWGHLGPRILGELRNDLLCFQFQCKCWESECLEECRDTRRGGESGLCTVCVLRDAQRPEYITHDWLLSVKISKDRTWWDHYSCKRVT